MQKAFFKAFDTIEHKFIFSTLALFVFGENFINVIKLMNKDRNSAVIRPQGTCPRSSVSKGIKPAAPSLRCSSLQQQELFQFSLKTDRARQTAGN